MLGHNPTQLDSFNKHNKGTQGTLIANWFEERSHRDFKGQGRAITRTHFPKIHGNLEESDGFGKVRSEDDTKYRILGDVHEKICTTENYHYGKGSNKVDTFAKTGRKQQLIEQMYLKNVTESINEQKRKEAQEARKGHFETTNKATFVAKPLNQNNIGKLVMRDQDGRMVGLNVVDEDLRETNGFRQRGQITTDAELRKLIDTDVGYEKQEPATFWREKAEDGTFYMSKPVANQAFGKNNEFLRTFKHYKHYND